MYLALILFRTKQTGGYRLKTKFQKLIKNLNVKNLVDDKMAIPRNVYRYTHSQRKDKQGIPPLKKTEGSSLAESESDQADEFNGRSTDIFTRNELM